MKFKCFIYGHFYSAVNKLTFLKKLFCLVNSITLNAMSANVLLVDHSKTKLYAQYTQIQ